MFDYLHKKNFIFFIDCDIVLHKYHLNLILRDVIIALVIGSGLASSGQSGLGGDEYLAKAG